MNNVEDYMAHLSIGGGEDDGVRIELEEGGDELVPGWDASLRAPSRRSTPVPSRWLIEEGMEPPKFLPLNPVIFKTNDDIMQQSSPLSQGQIRAIGFPQNVPNDSRRNFISKGSLDQDALGGVSNATSGQMLGTKN
ncbi:hypothetical protein V6N13_148328 [Hibiscus sabdariffa]